MPRECLPAGGVLYLYGPYKIDGRHTAPSNEAFDAQLRSQNLAWGIRDLADVAALAERHGFGLAETVGVTALAKRQASGGNRAMPANNLSVIFRRGASGRAPAISRV